MNTSRGYILWPEPDIMNQAPPIIVDSSRIPPNFYPSPALAQLSIDHPANQAWYKFHSEFFQLVGPKAAGAISGGPFALPEEDEDEGEEIAIFVVYIREYEIECGNVFGLLPDIRKLVDKYIPPMHGQSIPIRFYEWFFDVQMPPIKPQKNYEHNRESKMGHSVGAFGQPNPGTIFCFVDLFDKKTGEKQDGTFAIIPSHIAATMYSTDELKEGDRGLCRLDSPATSDSFLSRENAGKFVWQHRAGLACLELDAYSKAKATSNLDAAEKAYQNLDEFQSEFGTVIYASGVSKTYGREHDDNVSAHNLNGKKVPSRVDFAIVKLAKHRSGVNVLPDETGIKWPEPDALKAGFEMMFKILKSLSPLKKWPEKAPNNPQRLIKYGRTTRMTECVLSHSRLPYWYGGVEWADYAVIARQNEVVQEGGPLCHEGDSGAPYITVQGEVLGMHISGSSSKKTDWPKPRFQSMDFGYFMRWVDIVAEVEKLTEWKIEWAGQSGR